MDEKLINTISKRQQSEKTLLLEQLRKTPIVQIACEKAGVGRATYYRWRKEDEIFSTDSDEAIHAGQLFINDMAESQLISEIKNKNMSAITFWLKHNHPSFSTRVEIISEKNKDFQLSVEQQALLQKALELASLIPKKEEVEKDE